jgi:hypothetical protein
MLAPRIILIALLYFSCNTIYAQPGVVKGILKDSASRKPLSLATITIFLAKDTSVITYRLSDANGNFRVPSLPLNTRCRMLISFSGYGLYRKEFELTKDATQADLGTILLCVDPKGLEEVIVTAERPPMIIRNDTIEFNASSFKVLPTAVLEDLLKRLPGVIIDPDGNIRVRGRRVNRLLVDGKEFFGGDPQIATKNLPANIVDKIQVTDDKEELLRDPDKSPADVGQVVNIKLKRAVRQGWFGKAYAGGGTDNRHEAGGIVNIFRDTVQLSMLGYSNNINKPGFGLTEMQKIGGFNRSGSANTSFYSGGGMAINGISLGATGQGLQQSSGGGFNFNHQPSKRLTVNLQYFYGQINSTYAQISNRQRFFQDTVQVLDATNNNQNISKNHRLGGSITWKIDTFTTLVFRPSLTLSSNKLFLFSSTDMSDNIKGKLNYEENKQNAEGKGHAWSHSLLINRLFPKRQRSLTISNTLSVNDNVNNHFYELNNRFFYEAQPVDVYSNQLRRGDVSNLRNLLNIQFEEPVSKVLSLRFVNNTEIYAEENYLSPFNETSAGKYEELIDSLATGLDRKIWRNTITAGINWRTKKFRISLAANYLWMDFQNDFLKNASVNQTYRYIYPSLNFNWKSVSISYGMNVREPFANDLQPIVDNTNRLYLVYGNPSLKPVVSHNVSANLYKFNPKTNESYAVFVNGNLNRNTVIRENTIDSVGVQTSRPVNINGLKSVFGSATYNKQFRLDRNKWLSIAPAISGGYNESIVYFNGNRSGAKSLNASISMNLTLNLNDRFELNQRYAMNISHSDYDNNKYYKDLEVITHNSESGIVVRIPKNVVWESILNYTYNPQVSANISKSIVRLNGGVSYLFLKEKKGQLKISVFDLLDQNVSVVRYTNENYVYDLQTTTLRRYFMLSFIYNIRTFSGGKVGGRDRSFFLF